MSDRLTNAGETLGANERPNIVRLRPGNRLSGSPASDEEFSLITAQQVRSGDDPFQFFPGIRTKYRQCICIRV